MKTKFTANSILVSLGLILLNKYFHADISTVIIMLILYNLLAFINLKVPFDKYIGPAGITCIIFVTYCYFISKTIRVEMFTGIVFSQISYHLFSQMRMKKQSS